jgi:4-hydroxy-4-methyl-2-oxoglutarate aldolase
MLEEPPLLTLHRRFARPAPDLVDRFRATPASFVVDALAGLGLGGRGALAPEVKAIGRAAAAMVGVAFTVEPGPGDNLAVLAAAAVAEPGDVIVAATAGHRLHAVIGDLVLGRMKNRGLAGFVTDGTVRDVPEIEAVGLPCFATGVTPNSPVSSGPGTAGLPVVCGGVSVASGDIVVADGDGVVIVPLALAEATAAALERVRAAEADALARVRGGETVTPAIAALLASGRVREIGWIG